MTLPNKQGVTVPLHTRSLHYWLLGIGVLQAAITASKLTPFTKEGLPEDIFGVILHSCATTCFIVAGLFQKRYVRISEDGLAMDGAIIGNSRTKIIPRGSIHAIDELPKKFLIFHQKRPNQWTDTLVLPKKHLSQQEIISLRSVLRQLKPSEARSVPVD